MTQAERVLRALERTPDGITAADFSGLHGTPDGGPPITRVAARILELRGRGYDIVEAGKRDRCKVYKLVGSPHVPLPVPAAPEPRLFNAALGPYDDRAA